jgi:hypothetical protein
LAVECEDDDEEEDPFESEDDEPLEDNSPIGVQECPTLATVVIAEQCLKPVDWVPG